MKHPSLPHSWTRARIADVGSVRLGRQRSPEKHSGRYGTKYLRAKNVTSAGLDLTDVLEMDFTPSERATYELQAGDLLVAEASGSAKEVGRAAIWRNEIPNCCFQNTLIRLRPHAMVPEFGLLTLRHLAVTGKFEEVARGVGIQHLGASRFAEITIALPPLAEQARIAFAANQKLDDLYQAEKSLHSALQGIRSQEVEILAAAATGQLIEQETQIPKHERRPAELEQIASAAPGTPTERSLFPPGNPASGLTLPKGWVVSTVGEVGSVALGKTRQPASHTGDNMRPYLRVANVLEGRIDTSDVHRMHFSEKEAKTYELKPGDVLLNEGQSPDLVGRPALFKNQISEVCFQNTLLRFRPDSAVDPGFALIVFRHYLHAGIFKSAARWSTNIAHLTKTRFTALPFPVPPLAEQARIVAEVETRQRELSTQQVSIRNALDRVPELRSEILGAAVTGSLVPQESADESAKALLERLGPVASEDPPVSVSVRHKTDGANGQRSLEQVVRSQRAAIPLPDLCNRAGFDRNSVEDVGRFYVSLRSALGHTLRVAEGSGEENATVECVDAPR